MTTTNPFAFWDERYSQSDFAYGVEPNAFLGEAVGCLPADGSVLVPGDCEGRNGVWLSGRGMTVLSVDGSAVGLAKARRLAEECAVPLTTEHADLASWAWPQNHFDGVVAIFLHFEPAERARLHRRMVEALRPGGTLVLEAFRPEQAAYSSGGPRNADMLYSAAMLRSDFDGMEIQCLDEVLIDLAEGPYHTGTAATVRLIAVKSHRPPQSGRGTES